MLDSDIAISVEGVSKAFRIGLAQQKGSFGKAAFSMLSSPIRNFKALRSLDTARASLDDKQDGDGIIWAVRDVSFTLRRGEVLGIIGRNGAGKSTLLKILSRVTDPTVGRIRMRGRLSALLEVGTGFYPELTGRENVYLNGTILGMTRREIDRKFDEIVDFSGVEKFLDTPVKRYSSGMKVRLGFAVAAHLEPDILVVDEVLAVGDANFQRKCLGKMKEITNEGERTILFVSHNLTAVTSLCSRAIWLKDGTLLADDDPAAIVEQYLGENQPDLSDGFDLDRLGRTSELYGQSLRITRLTLNGGESVRHGEPLTARFDFVANEDVGGVAFGIGFDAMTGGRIVTIDSDMPGDRFEFPAGTSGAVELSIPNLMLQPGHFMISCGSRSGENTMLDAIQQFVGVEVLPGPTTPAVMIGRSSSGGVRFPPEVRVSLDQPVM